MPRRVSGIAVPRLYDLLMAPLERVALGRWRRAAWEEVPGEGRGLEIGTGTGANFSHYPRGARVIGTDISPAMLWRAGAREGGACRPLVAADAEALPFADASFQWVAETLVFCEVPNPVAGLREVRRVLTPGGRLIMLEHVRPGGMLGRVADAATIVSRRMWGEHFNRDADSAVRAAGLIVERREWLWRDIVLLLVARRPLASEAAAPRQNIGEER